MPKSIIYNIPNKYDKAKTLTAPVATISALFCLIFLVFLFRKSSYIYLGIKPLRLLGGLGTDGQIAPSLKSHRFLLGKSFCVSGVGRELN